MTTLRLEVLAKYPNEMFIETGTYDGSGCLVAIQCGFKHILSIEISVKKFQEAALRLHRHMNVDLVLGDTYDLFPLLMPKIAERQCTFWLDAHNPEDGVVHQHPGQWSRVPIMFELEAIAKHPIKTHTIMIDDLNHFRSGVFDHIGEEQLKDALRRINPDYRFVYEDGAGHETILVATP
jgi:hypothetical protein